ncbi:hypothetical protein N864_09000 [Intrasporangium chromatireducens Q5-1]|uniref:DUF8175 domain-containing protein n=1 Tax=Intrasporangium chromatireducens Q5-1 TaxID=584657 RepID=W9GL53_9MICO|nr:hypothetical protein [Intrasporangium chromatireducens]EWT04614.1 hypothetical protein N864_09000 [Intrasporangium chromatireducens Q5-1]
MATDDNEQEQSPFTRPGFIIAAIVVAIIVVLGIVVGINATRDQASPSPTTEPTDVAAPTDEPSPVASGPSVCGLEGQELSGTVSTPPEAQWEFQGTTAYPTSPTYGPGETDENGVRYCFQHSPEGALFAAANAAVQGSNPETVGPWLEYFIAEGPHRDVILGQGQGAADELAGVRVDIAGFRVLSYEGDTARVDIALRGSSQGQTVNLSMVYTLEWENGDWKLTVTDPSAPINVATIPDLSGYIAWGA